MPTHHPGEEILLAYSAGSLREPVALVVATHLALCPACRAEVERFDAVGGALIEDLKPEAVSETSIGDLLARLHDPVHESPAAPVGRSEKPDPTVPLPLRDYLGSGLDGLPWKTHGGLSEAELLQENADYRVRVMRIKAGTAMPWHTHEGSELTLVLAGGFTDEDKHYLRGDVAVADPTVNHRPVADPGEDCLCLAVTDAPLRLTGPIGRFLNRFVRI